MSIVWFGGMSPVSIFAEYPGENMRDCGAFMREKRERGRAEEGESG